MKNSSVLRVAWTQLLLVVLAGAALADGVMTGMVLDARTGLPVRGAQVTLEGSELSTLADLGGLFRLQAPVGEWTAIVAAKGYEAQKILNVVVSDGETAHVSAVLNPLAGASEVLSTPEDTVTEEITVQATALQATEAALLAERRASAQIVDNIGALEMSKNAGSDAAGALKRVTGISLQDNKYVFVRGLGDRYSNTQLNGSRIPTTEFEKKVVPLDLFPADLLEKVTISKSYTADQPGDFVAGVVRLETRDLPLEQKITVGLSGTYNTETTGDTLRGYPGGLSFSGGGGQGLPGGFPNGKLLRKSPFREGGFTEEELADLGRSLAGDWTPAYSSRANPDQGFKLSYGSSWDRVGLVVATTWGSSFEDRDEELNFYGGSNDGLRQIHTYDLEYGLESNKRALMANLAFRPSDNSQVQFRGLYTGNSQSEGRFQEGIFSDINGEIENYRLRFQEKEIQNFQLSGDHFFSRIGQAGSLLEWRASQSAAETAENLRENLYNENGGEFRWRQIGQSGFMFFNDLGDDLLDSRVDWSTLYASDQVFGSFKIGGAWLESDRDFDGRRFRFNPRRTNTVDLTDPAEILFSSENIGEAFVLREVTDVTDSYTARQEIPAAYAQWDHAFGNWRFVAGARFEDSEQEVVTLDRRQEGGTPATTVLAKDEVLPALSAVYSLGGRSALRASLSRTVNRPEFRELAPFEFAGIAGGFLVVGNPDLESATVDSLDLRWEWFPGAGEVVAASVFYKQFDDPIEEVVIAGAQQTQTYTNALEATNLGFELELRRSLGAVWESLDNWMAIVNYTFVDSEIEIDETQTVFTDPTRPLTGQPDNVLNFVLEWSPKTLDATTRLLYNFTDDKVFFAGSFGLPDLFEESRQTLDLVWNHQLGSGLSYKASATNLLDEDRTWTQGGRVHRKYSPGMGFGLSLGYSF